MADSKTSVLSFVVAVTTVIALCAFYMATGLRWVGYRFSDEAEYPLFIQRLNVTAAGVQLTTTRSVPLRPLQLNRPATIRPEDYPRAGITRPERVYRSNTSPPSTRHGAVNPNRHVAQEEGVDASGARRMMTEAINQEPGVGGGWKRLGAQVLLVLIVFSLVLLWPLAVIYTIVWWVVWSVWALDYIIVSTRRARKHVQRQLDLERQAGAGANNSGGHAGEFLRYYPKLGPMSRILKGILEKDGAMPTPKSCKQAMRMAEQKRRNKLEGS
ncbi:hypothetical protein B0H66DRAFT_625786 [Apodospora peruviana]|uniref:Uncharacterized protein n=1 Tax=Apodospora peruviana TaxID=516989 RepID=A0AAE0M2B4_9PEZI|nr:hypothetical protein B0H66DRAFT_625786 [Apodospora peruviana]